MAGERKNGHVVTGKNLKINTNMHIENVHRSLKHLYLEGKLRLDKSLSALTELVINKRGDKEIQR